jgi:hypothetical protein
MNSFFTDRDERHNKWGKRKEINKHSHFRGDIDSRVTMMVSCRTS